MHMLNNVTQITSKLIWCFVTCCTIDLVILQSRLMLWKESAIHWIEPYIYLLFLNLGCIIFGMKHTICSVNEIHGKQRFGTRQTVCCVWHTVNNSWHPTGRQTLLPCILFNGSSKKMSSQLTVGRYVFRTFALCFTDQRAYYQNNISLLPHGKDYVSGSV
jgi:hypothetical protein